MKKAIYVRIEEALIARLDEVGREQHRSRANLVETLLAEALRSYDWDVIEPPIGRIITQCDGEGDGQSGGGGAVADRCE